MIVKLVLVIISAIFASFTMPVLAGKPSTTETVNITDLFDQNVGAAAIVRKRQSVNLRINTTMLEPDSALTVWVAAFNKPGNCDGDCNGPDLDLRAVQGSLFFGTGFVTGFSGTANAEFEIQTGRLPEGTFIAGGLADGITQGNGFDVELHLIIADHGPSALIDDFADALSTPAPGVQFAVFK